MQLSTQNYHQGLHDLGNEVYAWLQPDGGWGWSNAGLICDSGQSLLVDTLFDLNLTANMLKSMRNSVPASQSIDKLVNTHANADHCNGNQLTDAQEIISTRATYEELEQDSPERLTQLIEVASSIPLMREYLQHCFGQFDFSGIKKTLPTRTFEDTLNIKVGNKPLQLHQVGPCHTQGDLLVYSKEDNLIFTGDILFIESHPIMWEGPVSNWIAACDYMLDLDLSIVVPGHGPITDKRGIRAVRDYLIYIRNEAYQCFQSNLSVYDAAMNIALSDYDSWGDAERIGVNVLTLYREFGHQDDVGAIEKFELMARIRRDRQANK